MTDASPPRILIIEDDPLSRRALATILGLDYVVTLAADGAQGLVRATSSPLPDLILLDIVLPDIDGFTILQQLHNASLTRDIPVMVITALDQSGDEEKGLLLGAIDYITKPYHPALVKTRVHNHLSLSFSRRLLTAPQKPEPVPVDTSFLLQCDFKTPLAAVLGTSQFLLRHGSLDNSARQIVSRIATASERLLSQTEDMLETIEAESLASNPTLPRSGTDCAAELNKNVNDNEEEEEEEEDPGDQTTDMVTGTAAAAAVPSDGTEIHPSRRDRVLVVDDEVISRRFLAAIFQVEYDVLLAKSGEQALVMAHSAQPPDIILLDVIMPGMDGYETLRRLKSDAQTRGIPVIFVTGLSSEDEEAKGLELGVVDYISKPYHPTVMRARVRNHLNHVRQRQRLASLATIDFLTGLSNRRGFEEALAKEWRRAARTGISLAVALLDIDDFKPFNEAYGHAAGDEALRQVAQAIAAPLRRPYDLAARYGGEEFAILFPHTDARGACLVAENIRIAIESLAIPHAFSTVAPSITVSLGVASAFANAASAPTMLITVADAALYRAKEQGRNRLVLADGDGT